MIKKAINLFLNHPFFNVLKFVRENLATNASKENAVQ